MFDKEAITQLQETAAIEQAAAALDSAFVDSWSLAALPGDYKVHDLEAHMPKRRRMRGHMSTTSIDAFAQYTRAHTAHDGGTSVFVNAQDMSATAVLNLGTLDEAGHADNTATLNLKQTAAFAALLRIADGRGHSQRDVAEFVEDWIGAIECFHDAEKLPPKQAVAAIRAVTIEGLRRVESQESSLSAQRGTFESVTASSKTPLPTFVYFTCEPYQGLAERTFVLRLGVLTGDDKPALVLRIIKPEEHQEAMAQELVAKVQTALTPDGPSVLIGTYSPK